MKFVLGGILIVIGIVIGFVSARFIEFDSLKLDGNINPVEVLTLCVMLFITLYIPAVLTNRLTNKRHVKDALIRRVEQVQGRFSEINTIVTDCRQKNTISNSSKNSILQLFTFLSNDIYTLNQLLKECDKNHFTSEVDKLNEDRRKYKGIVTSSDFQRHNYEANTKKEEEQAYTQMQGFLTKLIFKINVW